VKLHAQQNVKLKWRGREFAAMERFLPGRHQIDSFGNGGFRLGGVSHQGSLLITPSGVRALPSADINEITQDQITALLGEKSEIDMLLVGTGKDIAPIPKAIRVLLSENRVSFDVMSTNAAVRTYNVVLAEERRVAAILIAVDKAYG
jgi:uncharacterized protein